MSTFKGDFSTWQWLFKRMELLVPCKIIWESYQYQEQIQTWSNSLLSLIIVGIYYLFLSFTVFFFLFLFFVSLFVIRRLLQQLNAYAPGAQSKEKSAKTASTPGSEADYVTYELYYRPEQAQFSKNARVSSWILCLIWR